ncbi:hypothetical protein F5Y15DRAFT_209274 [Xylariaceae sp. FL0016]|nr:hypothetical protein F5Y15DRAFT_209274 [Xylariaceae sp. FL0016]
MMHHTYESVSTADSDAALDVPSSPNRKRKTVLLIKDIVLMALGLLGLVSLTFNIASHLQNVAASEAAGYVIPRRSCYCGETTTEARQRGCKYDSLAAAWLPDHCRDDELTAEFEQSGDGPDGRWLYWADKQHTKPLTLEQIAEMGNDANATFHMSGQWHVVHCFFFWRKEHRSRFNGKFVEGRFDGEEHILHCQRMVLAPPMYTKSGVTLDADSSVLAA